MPLSPLGTADLSAGEVTKQCYIHAHRGHVLLGVDRPDAPYFMACDISKGAGLHKPARGRHGRDPNI
jgi:hypothetical protein